MMPEHTANCVGGCMCVCRDGTESESTKTEYYTEVLNHKKIKTRLVYFKLQDGLFLEKCCVCACVCIPELKRQ